MLKVLTERKTACHHNVVEIETAFLDIKMSIKLKKKSSDTTQNTDPFIEKSDIQQEIEKRCVEIECHIRRIQSLQHMQQNSDKTDQLCTSSHEQPITNPEEGQESKTSKYDQSLENFYRLFLSDLKSSPVKYIQTIYKDTDRGKIVVDIKKGKFCVTCKALHELLNSNKYYIILDIVECGPGEHLMHSDHLSNVISDLPRKDDTQYNIRIGSGSRIGCVSVNTETLHNLLKDKDMRSIKDIEKKYAPASKGTLTCLVKHRARYYTMTAQHVLDKKEFFSREKQIFSQVHLECKELLFADIVHLASRYSGKMGILPVAKVERAVDVALMPLSQSQLDEALLVRLPVYCRAVRDVNEQDVNVEDFDTTLKYKRVKKRGAVTGITEGKIMANCMAALYPEKDDSVKGEMFAVVGLSNTTQPFAIKGDSGAIVTIETKGKDGTNEEHALGIVAQSREMLMGHTNVTLCVRMEDCLKVLESVKSVDGSDEPICSTSLELYIGFLRPFASLHDRSMPHVEEATVGAEGGTV